MTLPKAFKIILILIIIALLGFAVWWAWPQWQNNWRQQLLGDPVSNPNLITINNQNFSIPIIIVKPGDTVTWRNNDSVPHVLKSNEFESSQMNPGDNFSHTFTKEGEYLYNCTLHPQMVGRIVVRAN